MATTKTYNNGQIIYDGSVIDDDENTYLKKLSTASPDEFPRDASDITTLNYQQIYLSLENNAKFKQGFSYYVKLTLPRDKVFNFNYALRLLNRPQTDSGNLDAITNYELIKYLNILPISQDGIITYNNVIMYQEKNGEEWETIYNGKERVPNVHVKVAIDVTQNPSSTQGDKIDSYDKEYLKDKILKYNNESVVTYWVFENNTWRSLGNSNPENYWVSNPIPISHMNVETSEQNAVFEFIFTPLYQDYDTIYLNLIPDSIDSDIHDSNYYGRYIKNVDDENIPYEIYKIKDLTENTTWINMGVWGRSELMMAINGVEIKVGPSGYYELRDYDITSFGVVAKDYKDKFTVDYQY